MPRPISASIDLDALVANYARAKQLAPHSRALATIKADAYGHGFERTARALAGADGYAVCEIERAAELRARSRARSQAPSQVSGRDQPVLLLEGCFSVQDLRLCSSEGITPVVHEDGQVRMLESTCLDSPVDVFVKMNTGMNRLGLPPARFVAAVDRLRAAPAVRSITLMTHFACADEPEGVAGQLAVFDAHLQPPGHPAAATAGLPRSLANSAALLRYPESHASVVRPGIMLYGVSPFAGQDAASLGLRPAMQLASELIATRELQAGERVGYAGAFRAERPMRIGIVACGYADGYPRHAPTGTPVLVDRVRTRTIGRVSMDMLAVDLDPVPQAAVGSPVVLWGAGLPAEEVAAAAGTIAYEMLCALAPRVPVREVDRLGP
jgi:alanine racemase